MISHAFLLLFFHLLKRFFVADKYMSLKYLKTFEFSVNIYFKILLTQQKMQHCCVLLCHWTNKKRLRYIDDDILVVILLRTWFGLINQISSFVKSFYSDSFLNLNIKNSAVQYPSILAFSILNNWSWWPSLIWSWTKR